MAIKTSNQQFLTTKHVITPLQKVLADVILSKANAILIKKEQSTYHFNNKNRRLALNLVEFFTYDCSTNKASDLATKFLMMTINKLSIGSLKTGKVKNSKLRKSTRKAYTNLYKSNSKYSRTDYQRRMRLYYGKLRDATTIQAFHSALYGIYDTKIYRTKSAEEIAKYGLARTVDGLFGNLCESRDYDSAVAASFDDVPAFATYQEYEKVTFTKTPKDLFVAPKSIRKPK